MEPLQCGPLAHVQYTGSHVTLYTVFLRGYWRLDTLVIMYSWSNGSDHMVLSPPPSGYKEYHTDTTVKFLVSMTRAKMDEAEAVGLHKKFKLEGSLNTSNLVRAPWYSPSLGCN